MNKTILRIYHAPTGKTYQCLCLFMEQFTADCEKYMIDEFINFSVNPDIRFYSRVDGLVNDIVCGKKTLPHKFRMRVDSRHTYEQRPLMFSFRIMDNTCFQCGVFLNSLPEKEKTACTDKEIDFVIMYKGTEGIKNGDDTAKDGFCGLKPQVPALVGGACPAQ